MKTPREKYYNDANYKYLVDIMVNQIVSCNYTPSEMREASILASIIHEEIKPYPNIKMIKQCFDILGEV